MKKTLTGIAAVLMMMSLAGCSQSTSEETTGQTEASGTTAANEEASEADGSEEGYEIAYLCPSMDNQFWRYMATGVEREAEELGNVIVTTYDSKNSADIQYTNAQDVIVKGVDGIVISPTDSASCVAVLSLAEEAGIPVAISDIGTDSGEYVTYVQTNNFDGAKEEGEYLASLIPDGGQVAEIVGPQARQNQQDRKAGFEEGLSASGAEVVDFRQMEKENRSEGETYTQDYLTAYPDLKAIFCTNGDATLGVLAACQAAGRNEVLIMGFDCNEELLEEIQEGTIAGISAQQPLLMGAKALDGVVAHLNGEEVEKDQQVETLLVTKDNINEVYDTLMETAIVIE